MGVEDIIKKWDDENARIYGHGKYHGKGIYDKIDTMQAGELKDIINQANKEFQKEQGSVKNQCQSIIGDIKDTLESFVNNFDSTIPTKSKDVKNDVLGKFEKLDELVEKLQERNKLIQDIPDEIDTIMKKEARMEKISDFILKISKELIEEETEEAIIPDTTEQPDEEPDRDTVIQEHLTNNKEKYSESFEKLFPDIKMIVKNVEYRGMISKDKIRVNVEFDTPILNEDALKVMSIKDIGLEAIGERTFRVYNIFLPRVKDVEMKDL